MGVPATARTQTHAHEARTRPRAGTRRTCNPANTATHARRRMRKRARGRTCVSCRLSITTRCVDPSMCMMSQLIFLQTAELYFRYVYMETQLQDVCQQQAEGPRRPRARGGRGGRRKGDDAARHTRARRRPPARARGRGEMGGVRAMRCARAAPRAHLPIFFFRSLALTSLSAAAKPGALPSLPGPPGSGVCDVEAMPARRSAAACRWPYSRSSTSARR